MSAHIIFHKHYESNAFFFQISLYLDVSNFFLKSKKKKKSTPLGKFVDIFYKYYFCTFDLES